MATDESNTTISFRLPQAEHDKLARQADEAGITKHQLARTLLVKVLLGEATEDSAVDLPALEEAFLTMNTNFTDLRMALGRGIGAILQHVAPDMDKEQIRRWVFERIISHSSKPVDGKAADAEH